MKGRQTHRNTDKPEVLTADAESSVRRNALKLTVMEVLLPPVASIGWENPIFDPSELTHLKQICMFRIQDFCCRM